MRLILTLFLFYLFPFLASAAVPIPKGGRQPFTVETSQGNLRVYSIAGTTQSSLYFKNPTVSNSSPSVSAKVPMPFANKGGEASEATLAWPVSPTKVSEGAAKALEASLAGLSSGNGYVAVASVACAFVCQPLLEALRDWGVENLKPNADGTFSVSRPFGDFEVSDGYWYRTSLGSLHLSPQIACETMARVNSQTLVSIESSSSNSYTCKLLTSSQSLTQSVVSRWGASSCPPGHLFVGETCAALTSSDTHLEPVSTYLESNYRGKGWDHYWAGITAGLVAAGVNVFTDGTGSTITGPAVIPLSTTETRTPINLSPGTTTPAPIGNTGVTDPGIQTTTTTTTANNTYRPGSSGSGPSMQTTTKTETTTSITNNVTNVTNIVNETTTEKDDPTEDLALDSPLGDVPELYKQKYPDGLSGVWNDFKADIDSSSFVQLIHLLTPNISGAGVCPSWTIDLTWTPGGSMGVHNVGQDFCWIWPILKIIVMVTTLFTVRRLIFGG